MRRLLQASFSKPLPLDSDLRSASHAPLRSFEKTLFWQSVFITVCGRSSTS